MVVVARFRHGDDGERPVTLERLRRAHEFARSELNVLYPFASLKLKTSLGHVLHEFEVREPGNGEGHLALDMGGQWVLPGFVTDAVNDFDFADQWASRWFPAGRSTPIVVDPLIAAGRPVIVGTRVPVMVISQRFKAGDSIDFLSEDFEVDRAAIEQALRFAA
ncbi:MAG: DUF433 domain-containing protein [Chloroflexi bacterium]|nr:DUF433 domain-containing protein [Chloroflexota bacterium]